MDQQLVLGKEKEIAEVAMIALFCVSALRTLLFTIGGSSSLSLRAVGEYSSCIPHRSDPTIVMDYSFMDALPNLVDSLIAKVQITDQELAQFVLRQHSSINKDHQKEEAKEAATSTTTERNTKLASFRPSSSLMFSSSAKLPPSVMTVHPNLKSSAALVDRDVALFPSILCCGHPQASILAAYFLSHAFVNVTTLHRASLSQEEEEEGAGRVEYGQAVCFADYSHRERLRAVREVKALNSQAMTRAVNKFAKLSADDEVVEFNVFQLAARTAKKI